jgi:hypothetical protein
MVDSATLTTATVIRRSGAILASALGEKTVMMDIEQGLYYGLNPVGTSVWQLTEHPTSIQHVCDQLLATFDVSPDRCQRDVMHVISHMLQHDIVEIVDGAIAEPSSESKGRS